MSDCKKCTQLKRRLRNSIAHCKYTIEVRTTDGQISNDKDLWFIFEDNNKKGDDPIIMEVNFPTFGNIVEKAGSHCIRKMDGMA